MGSSQESQIQAVVAALQVFSAAPDKASLDQANAWLLDFQHSSGAWAICNTLLLSPDAPEHARFFAAQTFRAKVTYDLHQVDNAQLLQLRDTLLSALQAYAAGPRRILVQLSLALSGLALQSPQWEDPVKSVVDLLGTNPATVPALLEFLKILPEEVTGNSKIPLSTDAYKTRAASLLTANVQNVVNLLSLYVNAQGLTDPVQGQIFMCLRSWLNAGEVMASTAAQTPLFDCVFNALASEELFDTAVDVICDLIHETQEIDDNMPVIERIVPRLIELKPMLAQASDDSDKMRGLCRLFTEAGETYRMLLIEHSQSFFPVVEAIAECTAYHDLDIVPITFNFWYRLAQSLNKRASIPPLFTEAYKALVEIMIRHLHFPADPSSMSGQEADDFRSFRHYMGDTLKDCCHVLGAQACLMRAHELLTNAMARAALGEVSWQEIEAPLFSMRSMGTHVDIHDDKVLPRIMDTLPALPNHPRIRYAAILVISRYTEWLDAHPTYIPFQLQYVSNGFEDPNQEVSAASGQAIKFLCKDCRKHLVPFLPQLHAFVQKVGPKLLQDDKLQIYEAVAHVLSSMPMEDCAQGLQTFSLDILADLHNVAVKPTPASKDELQRVADGLEQLETMLAVIHTFGDVLPAACQGTCEKVWTVLNQIIQQYGGRFFIAERVTRVIRHGLQLFASCAMPVVPSLLESMAASFEATGFSNYLWIAGKTIGRFGLEAPVPAAMHFSAIYERSTLKVVDMLRTQSAHELPDVVEDYLSVLIPLSDFAPEVLFTMPSFDGAFYTAVEALNLVQAQVALAALDFLRGVLLHNCLDPPSAAATVPAKWPGYVRVIKAVFDKHGPVLLANLLRGICGDFPQDGTHDGIVVIRTIAGVWPSQVAAWLPHAVEKLPLSLAPATVKAQFTADITKAMLPGRSDEIRPALLALVRETRKVKDRRNGLMR